MTAPDFPCHQCGVSPGELHKPGCYVERCALCGGESISCPCVYVVNGIDPDISHNGATDEKMWDRYDDEVEKYGGRISHATGHWPGIEDAALQLNMYCRWTHRTTGKPMPFPTQPGRWRKCGKDDAGALPDVNEIFCVATWSRVKRKWEVLS